MYLLVLAVLIAALCPFPRRGPGFPLCGTRNSRFG
jgi:hypothetical protein